MAERRRARGSGSVREHAPSASWRAVLPRRLDPDQHAYYFPTRELAVSWLDAEIARLSQPPAPPTAADLPLRTYTADWLQTVAASADWSDGTVRTHVTLFSYLDALGDRTLADVTRRDLQAIVADLQANGGYRAMANGTVRRRKLTADYLHLVVGAWRRAFQTAVEDGLIAHNPAARLVLPPRELARRPGWTPDEARAIAAASVGTLHEAVLALVFSLGLRVAEAIGVAWEDVDFERKRVRIWRQGDRRTVRQRTKGRTDTLMEMLAPLEAALRRQAERQTWDAVYVSEWRPGVRVSRDTLTAHLKQLAASVGARPLSPHAARHAAGNVLGAAGVPLATIAARLRHRDPAVTARWYLETERAGERAASELLSGLFGEAPERDNGYVMVSREEPPE